MWPLIASISNALIQAINTCCLDESFLTGLPASLFSYVLSTMQNPEYFFKKSYISLSYKNSSIPLGIKTNSLQSKILDNPPWIH